MCRPIRIHAQNNGAVLARIAGTVILNWTARGEAGYEGGDAARGSSQFPHSRVHMRSNRSTSTVFAFRPSSLNVYAVHGSLRAICESRRVCQRLAKPRWSIRLSMLSCARADDWMRKAVRPRTHDTRGAGHTRSRAHIEQNE